MSKRNPCKAPAGCFWRAGVLYGRIQTSGQDIKWSLRTDDPKVAASRRKAERSRVVAAQRYGDQHRTFVEAMEAWGRHIADNIGTSTLRRYLSSLAVLQPHLEGMYLDEIDKKVIGGIVEARRNVPYVPKGKKHPIKVSIATVKRDLTALSSIFDFCVDQEWMETNPAMEWLKPGHRKKSRLQERRDPIVLPEMAHIQMVIDRAAGLFGRMIEAAVKTGARLDELGKVQRHHFDRARGQLTVVGKRNKLRVLDLEDGGEDFGLALFLPCPPRWRPERCSGIALRRANEAWATLRPDPTARYHPTSGASLRPWPSSPKNRISISGPSGSMICAMSMPCNGSKVAVPSMLCSSGLATPASRRQRCIWPI